MKFVLMFCADGEDVHRFQEMTDAERAAQYAQVGEWFQKHQDRIIGGRQLQAPEAATTVRWDRNGLPLTVDGPFLELKEVIGGYAEVEVENLDQALEMARSWPPRGAVEVRPVLET